MNKIVVIGSSNTDMVIQSSKLPAPGETVIGGDLVMNPGGKGANQAVAASKLGGDVTFIARLGTDMFGDHAVSSFEDAGMSTHLIQRDQNRPSGVALIMVDDRGENSISVALGANQSLSPDDVDQGREDIINASYCLMQLETPLQTIQHAAQMASFANTKVVLNPAPAQKLPKDILKLVDIITPNETEAEILTGVKVHDERSAKLASQKLREMGVQIVIVTLGAQGAYVYSDSYQGMIQSCKVQAVDTTAAGDTFNGALVVALAEGKGLIEAVQFANRAASLSVTKLGAQQSIPMRIDVDQLLTK